MWVSPVLGFTIVIGVLTPSVLLTWVSLEVSLLLFLTLLRARHSTLTKKEDVLYYFINQALGRTIILFSWVTLIKNYVSFGVIELALILKIGLFPFHS